LKRNSTEVQKPIHRGTQSIKFYDKLQEAP